MQEVDFAETPRWPAIAAIAAIAERNAPVGRNVSDFFCVIRKNFCGGPKTNKGEMGAYGTHNSQTGGAVGARVVGISTEVGVVGRMGPCVGRRRPSWRV